MDFVHLHNHTEFSLLDGMLKINKSRGKTSDFMKTIAGEGVRAMAITDHGNMYGAIDFYFAAKDVGIHPIIGCEMYEAAASRLEKSGENGHLTVLARTDEGYQNMLTLMSDAFLNGFYNRPRIDKELLAKHSGGLIILSGCMQSQVSQACLKGNIDEAARLAAQYRDMVGEGNFYLEIMDHGIPEEKTILQGILEVAKRTGLPLVATNDCHYHKKEDWQAHDVHLCIATGSTLDDPNRFKMTTHELYFKSAQEMKQLFSFCPEAIKNTVEIANKCQVEIKYGKSILPIFPLPPDAGTDNIEIYLREKCLKGLKEKLGTETIPPTYMERLNFELGVINKMQFPSYFLIVNDFITAARAMGVPVGPGRGSGAGSLVSYSLDITRVDPLVNNLLFERFLNPDRISMPDLDIDFSDEGRTRVIEYVRGKYGANNVANIITFGTIKAKLAIKDVARALGFPPVDANRIAKLIPNALDATVAGAIETVPELSQEAARDSKVRQLLDFAQKIEGLKRHTGVHAAGVVVTREEVTKYSPIAVGAKKIVTTQYEGPILEKLGLLKMDFLGLRTLTVIDKAVEMVNANGGNLDISKIPLDDEKTFELLRAAETTGIFQLESRGMRDLVKSLKPTQFSDISALVALYRPGPMQAGMLETFVGRKHGRKKIVYDHPLMEPILKETYGTIIYQEQVMEIAKSMAGFTPGQADGLRKAMGKKNLEAMQKDRERFLEGCAKKDVPPALAKKIFDQMEQFASYGFNKSHSVAYALVSYQTAYLKANYPVEFMTSALTSEIGHNAIGADDKENKIVTYLEEARRMEIPVMGPDVQYSLHDFSIEKTQSGERGIRFGLHAVKNVGDEAAASIVTARSGGKFKSLQDLCMRIDSHSANKKTFESLIKAGAMDSLLPGSPKEEARARLLAGIEREMGTASVIREEKASGQGSLFGLEEQTACACPAPAENDTEPLSEHELLNNEKEVLGFYLSGHPLVRYEKQLRMIAPGTIAELREAEAAGTDGEELPRSAQPTARIAGIIVSAAKKISKAKKEPWAQLVVEDLTGRITVNVFPKNYPDCAGAIKVDAVVAITGRVSIRPESDPPEAEIVADDVVPVAQAISRYGRCLKVKVSSAATEDRLKALSTLMHAHRGDTPLYIVLEYSKDKKTLVQTEFCVSLGEKLFEELDKMVTPRGWLVESGAPASAPPPSFKGRKNAH